MLQLQPARKLWPACRAGGGRQRVLTPTPWGHPSSGQTAIVGGSNELGSVTSPGSPEPPAARLHSPSPQPAGCFSEELGPGCHAGARTAAACNVEINPHPPFPSCYWHLATTAVGALPQVHEQSPSVPVLPSAPPPTLQWRD